VKIDFLNRWRKLTGALVIGGHVQGLGLVRALGENDIPVYVLDETKYNIARFSKYCEKFLKIPEEIYDSEKKYVEFFSDLVKKEEISDWVVFPTDDRDVKFLSKNKEEFSEFLKITTPDWSITKKCYDKKLTYKIADEIGIPIPKTEFPKDRTDLEKIDEEFEYPIILKPAVMHEFREKTGKKVWKIDNFSELKEKYHEALEFLDFEDIIVQEIIPGEPENLFSYGSFFKKEKEIGYVVGKRKRQIPMDFGDASTFVEAVDNQEVRELGQKLLSHIDYRGMSEVEFKRDPRDGEYKLLEINPRSWKWHSIAPAMGVNLPFSLFEYMNNRDIPHQSQTNTENISWFDFYTDIYIAFKEVLNGRLKFFEYVNMLKSKRTFSVLQKEDLKPFLYETIFLPYLYMSRR